MATIVGIMLVLGLALTASPAYASGWIDGLIIKPDCHCGYAGDCSCRMLLNRPAPCDYYDMLNYLRGLDYYYGEDDDYIYLKAEETDPENHLFEPSINGSLLMVYSKALIQTWVVTGCPDGAF